MMIHVQTVKKSDVMKQSNHERTYGILGRSLSMSLDLPQVKTEVFEVKICDFPILLSRRPVSNSGSTSLRKALILVARLLRDIGPSLQLLGPIAWHRDGVSDEMSETQHLCRFFHFFAFFRYQYMCGQLHHFQETELGKFVDYFKSIV